VLAAKPSKGAEERLVWTLRNTWLAFTLGLYGDAVESASNKFSSSNIPYEKANNRAKAISKLRELR
jgi:hypothetical protein